MAVLHCKTKLVERVGTELRVQMWQRQLISSMFISRKWEFDPIRQFKLSVLLCILCKCNCRRSSSHCKSATQFAPQKCFSLITEKFPKEEGGQWPTSVTHFAKVTYLRPRTRLFHSPTLRRLGLCCDRSKPPRGRDVEQFSPRPDWIQNRQAHPGGRSQKLPPEAEQQDATLVKIPVTVKMSASIGSSIIQSRSWYEDSGSNEPEQSGTEWWRLKEIQKLD